MQKYLIIFTLAHIFYGLSANSTAVKAAEIKNDFFGYALLRYENETELTNKPDRERIRLIAQGGLKTTWTSKWQSTIRLSTGLKNKQNVPALTLYRFTEQAQPDNDLYIDQAFVQYTQSALRISAGKLPWQLYNVTDVFWDRHLNPIGLAVGHQFSPKHNIQAAILMPLDGESGTIGQMYLGQYKYVNQMDKLKFTFAPWFAVFNGQFGAQYASRDTQYDHRSLRLSSALKYKKWQIGIDTGFAFDTPDQQNKQNLSITSELRYGGLKRQKDWLLQISYSHVERYAVVREFGQNARAAALTTNFSGWDFRWRYKLNKKAWIGTRFSSVNSLYGNTIKSNRFRIEARWSY